MSDSNIHSLIVGVAIVCCTVLAAIDLFHGGDGATITGSFAVISGLAGASLGAKLVGNSSSN